LDTLARMRAGSMAGQAVLLAQLLYHGNEVVRRVDERAVEIEDHGAQCGARVGQAGLLACTM
jgi:hypothetical protein